MGKGDMKTKKGKIFRGSHGVRRPKKKKRIKKAALTKNPQENAPDLQEKMSDIKVSKQQPSRSSSKGKSKT